MAVKLNGNTSGYVQIDAPAIAGVSNLTLPVGNGAILSDHDNTYNFTAKGGFSNVWTTNTPTGFATKQGLVAYAPTGGNTGIFLSKPINTNTSYYSLNGTTWYPGPTIANAAGTTLANSNVLVYLPNPTFNSPGGKFVLGVGNTTLYYVNFSSVTNSAVNWSKSSAPANVVHMAYGAGKLVVLTANATTSFYSVSEDANTFSPQVGAASSGLNPKYMHYFPDLAGGRFMSYQKIYGFDTSQDGYSWDPLSYSGGNITIGSNALFTSTTLNSPVSYNGNNTYLAVTNNYIASSADCITWNIVNAAATLGVGNTAWYSLGAYGGYNLFTSGSTGVIYGVANDASTISTIYAAPGINAISGPGFISTPWNYTIFDNSTTGNNISTFSYGTTVINPQQRGYMDNIIIGESIPTKGRFNELLATELTIAYHSPNNAVGGYNLMTMAGGYLTIQAGGSGSTTVMSPGSFYLGVPGGANVAMQGNGFFAGSATANSYLYSSGLYFNQNNVNGTNGLFSVAQVYMNPVGGSNSSGTGGFWLRPDTGLFLGNTAASFQINLSANTGAYLYLGSFTQSTTGTGGAIVNTSMYFIGNNTINAYMSTNYAAGNLALVMQNTTTNAYLTPNTLFIGNDSINTTVNTVSIYINPTSGANTTGTGGLSISPINGIFFGNNTTNATVNTTVFTLGSTSDTGGVYISSTPGGTSNLIIGNNSIGLTVSAQWGNSATYISGGTGGTGTLYFTQNTNFGSNSSQKIVIGGNSISFAVSPGAYANQITIDSQSLLQGVAARPILVIGGYTQWTTGTGASIVNVSTVATGNTYQYTSLSQGYVSAFATGTAGQGTVYANLTASNLFFGNATINTSLTNTSLTFSNSSTTWSFGSLGLSAPAASANIVLGSNGAGTSGFYVTGQVLFIGNNSSNISMNTTNWVMGAPNGGKLTIGTGSANTTGSGALQWDQSGGGPVLWAGNNTGNLYWNGTYSSEGSTLFVGTATGTGTGGGKVNTSSFFAGNNTVNAIISYNTFLGIQINPTAAANTTGSGGFITNGSAMFIGNNAANISFNAATAASPTINVGTGGTIGIAGSTTGTGGFVANSTTMLIGNNNINAVHSTSLITINPQASSNTIGGGGVIIQPANGTRSIMWMGNNQSNILFQTGTSADLGLSSILINYPYQSGAGANLSANNLTLGNSVINVSVNSTSITFNPVGSSMTTGAGSGANITSSGLFMGNNTVNTIYNSSSLSIQTATANTTGTGGLYLFQNGLFTGNNNSNTYINNNSFGIGFGTIANTTGTGGVFFGNSGGHMVMFAGNNTSNISFYTGTSANYANAAILINYPLNVGGAGANLAANNLSIGNSTINASINNISLAINPSAAANTTGAGGLYVTGVALSLGNTLANSSLTTTTLTVGGGTGTTTGTGGYVANSTQMLVGNNTINALHSTTTVTINPVAAATTTGTGGALVNTSALFIGNNTSNATVNTTGVYIGGKYTAAATGYTVLPGGIKMNWGSISANSLGVVGTFSSAFTTLYNVVISSTSATVTVAATASNTTTVTATTNSAASTTVYYHAIGV